MSTDRRTFLKRSGAALSAAAVAGCVPDTPSRTAEGAVAHLDGATLRAVGEVVLPSELGPSGQEVAVADFVRWADEYEPHAELNHGYGTSEIRHTGPDPVPAWLAQLAALDRDAHRAHGRAYTALAVAERRALLEAQALDGGDAFPAPGRAQHVAIALLAHWLASADATDRCYGRRIAERACRGIDAAPAEPDTL